MALTRASDRLIIAGAGIGNRSAGYAKSSWYRWCLMAMRALCGEDESDDPPEARLSIGEAPITAPRLVEQVPPPADMPSWLATPAGIPEPPLRLAAPSRLTEDRAAVLQPFGPERTSALRRGRLIHGLLQTLPDVDAASRDSIARRFLARAPEVTESEIEEMVAVTLQTLEHPDFADLFAPGGRSEAAIVGTLPGGQLVNGRVDRLIIQPDQVLIVDYKTDRPAPLSAELVDTAYWVQMAAYRAVFQSLYPDRPVRCALLYTDGPRLIELSGAEMSESLNRVESRV